MQQAYPELVASRETVARVIRQEEGAFAETLAQGLRDYFDRAKKLQAAGSRTVPGEDAFFLYDTRGLPLEIIQDLAEESGLVVDEAGFQAALESQRDRSRMDYLDGRVREEVAQSVFEGRTTFVGYGYSEPALVRVRALVVDGERAERIADGQKGEIVFEQTPFYAASGGQVGDTGALLSGSSRARVVDTLYRGTTITHVIEVKAGAFEIGDEVTAAVDLGMRRRTMKNHTATHLLHAALKAVLGPHVKQAGSRVDPERLRFDFTHYAPMSPAEIGKVEDLVNEEIWANKAVDTEIMELDAAMRSGAVALFGEKYQDRVRVVEVAGFSKELCGGTHVPATGAIGAFKIVSEAGIAAGVRRIEALTGPAALRRFREDEEILDAIQAEYKIQRSEVPAALDRLHGQIRDLQRQIAELKVQHARSSVSGVLAGVREVAGIKVLAHVLPETDRGAMRSLADELRSKLGTGVVILGTPLSGKAALLVMVSPELSKKLPAGRIIKEIAPVVGGSGGGKPELAEAGGKDSSRLADAIERAYSVVEDLLAR
jgi:alanyl-tRNA synthetase